MNNRPLILVDAAQIVTPSSPAQPQRGKKMGKLQVWKKSCLSVDPRTGKILAIGTWKHVRSPNAKIIEAKNHLVLPAFVDSHTHPIYAGNRVDEFQALAAEKSYLEILTQGGGIHRTVVTTRKATDSDLTRRAQAVFQQMLNHGTATVEAKTGYGLSTKEELRHLQLLRKIKKNSPLEIFISFLGAHAIPKEYQGKPESYVDLICTEMLPLVAKRKRTDFCDVFCDEGAFSLEQSEKILSRAKELGMGLRLHADEFKPIGGTELGVSLKAFSVDHLTSVSPDGIRALSESDTVATLLPCTTFFLGKENYAPARALIDSGAIVALATDFNAGSNLSFSMPMALSLALLRMKMTPEEAIVAGTLHGACALGVSKRLGSLHPGKQADLLLLHGEDYRETFYHFGTNPVALVIKNGKAENGNCP